MSITQCSKNPSLNFNHCLVNDIVFPPFVTEARIRDLSTFKTRPGDVFIVTYPKTGTLWVSEIVKNIAKPKECSGKQSFGVIGDTTPYFETATSTQLEAYPSPRYMFTHFPYTMVPRNSQHNLKYIYVARNPRDVAVSYFHFMRANKTFDLNGTWEEFLGYFIKGKVPYGSFFEHVLEWWKHKDDEDLLFIKYENMKKDLKGHVNIIAEFLGFKLSNEEVESIAEKCTFPAMKANPKINLDQYRGLFKPGTSFMRKGIVGDWANYFSDEQLAEFDKLYAFCMNGTGLEFEFT